MLDQPATLARDSLSDSELVALMRQGDRAAFAVVIQRHNRRLYRVARSVLRDDAEAEDIVQETYVSAFRNLGGFRGEARLSTWLTRIALNQATDRLRRKRPQVALSVIDDAENRAEGSLMSLFTGQTAADPERAASRAEIRRLVESAIDALPTPFRTVFVLREIEGMSIEETAAELDIKPETVKTRLHRARRQLRATLEDTLAAALNDAFPFAGARCAGMTERVLRRLADGGA
jgi:RNA polymerase sigma-70 factor (ECF subfamily)